MILACDGIWDCLSSEDACNKINGLKTELGGSLNEKNTSEIVTKLFE